jgi:hypothetical protein
MIAVFPDNSILNYISQSRPATANMLGLPQNAAPNTGGMPYTGATPPNVSNIPPWLQALQNAGKLGTTPQTANNPMANFNQSFGDLGSLTPQALQAYRQAQQQHVQQMQQALQAQQQQTGMPMNIQPQNQQGIGLGQQLANQLGFGQRTGPSSPAGYGGPSGSTSGNGLGSIW